MMQMMPSVVLAFVLGAILGKLLLPVLYKLKFGQNIYELAPEAHKKKQGTPIMGGLTFAGAAIVVSLLMNDYSVPLWQNMTLAVLLMALGNMCIGFADDMTKIRGGKNAGLTAKQKMIFQTGLAKMIGSKVMSLSGNSETRMFLLVILVTGAIGAFVSNTGTVALMLPIIVSMAAGAGKSPRRFLMPLAFASSMGGMMTLIGTPPNLIVSDTLANASMLYSESHPALAEFFKPLSFFSFLPVGLIILVVGTLYLLPATKMLSPKEKQVTKKKGKSFKELAPFSFRFRARTYPVRSGASVRQFRPP